MNNTSIVICDISIFCGQQINFLILSKTMWINDSTFVRNGRNTRIQTHLHALPMSLRIKTRKKTTHLYSLSRGNEEETAGNQLNSS